MTKAEQIRQIEELSLNATPALSELVHDGWLLRLTGGATRRVNSVQVLYPGTQPLREKIAFCESIYQSKKLPTIFKLTHAAQPPELDAALEKAGYAMSHATWVQTCALEKTSADHQKILHWNEPGDEWIKAAACAKSVAPSALARHRALVNAIQLPVQYMAIQEDGVACSCGFAVLQRPWIGLFDINTRIDCRNRGLAYQLVGALLAWGKTNGASHAYLQVEENNSPARRLYDKLGFKDNYRYWYRIGTGSSG